MKNDKAKNAFFISLSILAALAARIVLYAILGSTISRDSIFYIGQAKNIMQEGASFYLNHIDAPYYWGYPTFLAFLFSIFGENANVVCIVQIFLGSFSMALLYLSIFRMTGRPWISMLLTGFYNINLEVSKWDCYVLSDSLGMTMEALCIFFFVRLIDGYEKGKEAGTVHLNKPYDWILFAITALLYFFVRSNAIVIIFFMCMVLIFRLDKKKQIKIGVFFLALFVAFVSIIMWSGIMHPENINLRATFGYMIDGIRKGQVIFDRPEYDVRIASDSGLVLLFSYVFVIAKRIVYYCSVLLKSYSLIHKFLSIVAIAPVFLLALYSGVCAVKRRQRKYIELIFIILLSSLAQVLVQIDFDFRYRAPMFLFLILLGSYGLADFTDKIYSALKQKRINK